MKALFYLGLVLFFVFWGFYPEYGAAILYIALWLAVIIPATLFIVDHRLLLRLIRVCRARIWKTDKSPRVYRD